MNPDTSNEAISKLIQSPDNTDDLVSMIKALRDERNELQDEITGMWELAAGEDI